jgi:enoyl-CoA hydratase/3-hydroxypropionyl-coenzyme A dehydratase
VNDPRLPEELALAVRDRVGWLTLNRPQKANALNLPLLQGLERALADWAADESVRAVVLTGAGARTFSAGADLTRPPDSPEAHAAERRSRFAAVLFALVDFPKPAIAAVNGAACGAGMMLAVLCDAAIAAESARFSLPEINSGLPTLPGSTILSRRFDEALAADLVLSGRFMSADEALRRGVVAAVVPAGELEDRAQRLALERAKHDARAYAANKRWLNRELRAGLAAAVEASAQLHRH